MEDAGEAGIEAGMGFGRGFVHPLDTLSETAGRIVGLGHDLFRGDFSRISNATGREMATFASARAGEMAGIACGILPFGELATLSVRCSIGAVRAGYAGFLGKMALRSAGVAEARLMAKSVTQSASGRMAVASSATNRTGTVGLADVIANRSLLQNRNFGYVNLTTPSAESHILFGEVYNHGGKTIYGGGHLFPGLPGKTPFPRDWGRDKILHNISDVATDPGAVLKVSRHNTSRTVIEGERENVLIRVVVDREKEKIVTGFPIKGSG